MKMDSALAIDKSRIRRRPARVARCLRRAGGGQGEDASSFRRNEQAVPKTGGEPQALKTTVEPVKEQLRRFRQPSVGTNVAQEISDKTKVKSHKQMVVRCGVRQNWTDARATTERRKSRYCLENQQTRQRDVKRHDVEK